MAISAAAIILASALFVVIDSTVAEDFLGSWGPALFKAGVLAVEISILLRVWNLIPRRPST
jgi:hypothetical protein